ERKLAQVGSPWTSNLSEFRKRALIVRALEHIWSIWVCRRKA
ncbi:hypothetical protein HMPREF1585_00965, partial [Gardnerella vaginalis JCP8481B]